MSWELTVNCHQEQLLGLDDLKQAVQVVEDAYSHLCLHELGVGGVSVGAVVNAAIHVQVQVMVTGICALSAGWFQEGSPLAEPSADLGDACIRKSWGLIMLGA